MNGLEIIDLYDKYDNKKSDMVKQYGDIPGSSK